MSADRRRLPVRDDLAAAHLQGQVEAPRFATGRVMEVVVGSTPLRSRPQPDCPLDTEALLGERVTIYDEDEEGWAWGQLARDSYVGWLPAAALATPGPEPTHRVSALRTFLYPGPHMKLPAHGSASLGAALHVSDHVGPFAKTPRGFVHAAHLEPIATRADDMVAVAERFLGVPYLWGGKTSLGLDCSGLVQVAAQMAGLDCPRDSDMQSREAGLPLEETAGLRRGDLVFWKGHVAMFRDNQTILHANAYHMLVTAEPFAAARERIAAREGNLPTGFRRFAPA